MATIVWHARSIVLRLIGYIAPGVPVPASHILSEASDNLATESSDLLITEA